MADKVQVDRSNPDAVHQEVGVSAELATIVGKGPMARGEVTSKLWDYIHQKGLQAKDDGRDIEPDETLGKIVGSKRLTMFEMTAAVNKHIRSPEKGDEEG
jgi:chromatin remodeling complex protein RSC6